MGRFAKIFLFFTLLCLSRSFADEHTFQMQFCEGESEFLLSSWEDGETSLVVQIDKARLVGKESHFSGNIGQFSQISMFKYSDSTRKFDVFTPRGEEESTQESSLHIEPFVSTELQKPVELSLVDLMHILAKNKLVIYTGAGISSGAVPTMPELLDSIFSLSDSKSILDVAVEHPHKVLQLFDDFFNKCENAEPTKAHLALHSILSANPGFVLLTENLDLLHEKAGDLPVKRSDFVAKRAEFEEAFKQTDCMLVIGLGSDESGLINLYRRVNPKGVIIAINLEIPCYLTQKDYIVSGKASEIIPIIADKSEK